MRGATFPREWQEYLIEERGATHIPSKCVIRTCDEHSKEWHQLRHEPYSYSSVDEAKYFLDQIKLGYVEC
jgi:hypothetical protein